MDDVIIIGGGAAGMFAATICAEHGYQVRIIEKNENLGKKLSATGNGRCNFTNTNMNAMHYYCEDKSFVESVLTRFGAEDAKSFFFEHGIPSREKDGYWYPYSNQASSVVKVLGAKCKKETVAIHLKERVEKIIPGESFQVQTNLGTYLTRYVFLFAGGLAASKLGGSKDGYVLAKELGHQINPCVPALTGLVTANKYPKMSGARIFGDFRLYVEDRFAGLESGEIQLVDQGVSGIPVFQLSRIANMALQKGKKVTGEIDFAPFMTENQMVEYLHNNDMRGFINQKCMGTLIHQCGSNDTMKLAQTLKHFKVTIIDSFGMEKAQVTAGGIPTDEIKCETMESKIVPNLYFAGEIMDVDGKCGGYNLQWAWATAYIAAMSIIGGKTC